MNKLIYLLFLIFLLGCHSNSEGEESISGISHENKELHHTKGRDETRQLIPHAQTPKEHILLNVPLIKQNPELKYGCEVTSLAMVLQYAGIHVNKMTLYKEITKENDPLIRSKTGNIIKWGDPNRGFVGDMTGKFKGYAVFDKPIQDLVEKYMPGHSVNMTNKPFIEILNHVSKGYPVVVWTTGDYKLPDRHESWKHGSKIIRTPLDLHAVVIVGFDKDHVYLNDSLSGKKNIRVPKNTFLASWKALQSRAVSYK